MRKLMCEIVSVITFPAAPLFLSSPCRFESLQIVEAQLCRSLTLSLSVFGLRRSPVHRTPPQLRLCLHELTHPAVTLYLSGKLYVIYVTDSCSASHHHFHAFIPRNARQSDFHISIVSTEGLGWNSSNMHLYYPVCPHCCSKTKSCSPLHLTCQLHQT